MTNAKVLSALRNGLQPLICIGETAEERDSGAGTKVVERQVAIALRGVEDTRARDVLLAYEPVWAIGASGMAATPDYVNEVLMQIRGVVEGLLGIKAARSMHILYGGSVNRDNAAILSVQPELDGLFIGRSGWEVDSFIQLIRVIEDARRSW